MSDAAARPEQRSLPPPEGSSLSSTDVAKWICDRIRTGRLVPGQRLVEADLVRDTGATRTRVREALQRLGGEGLLLIEEFRGASVRRLTRHELGAVYRTRAVLESLAAAEFTQRAGDDEKQRLRQIQSELDVAVAAIDHAAFSRLNEAWHKAIIDGSRNTYISQFVERLHVPVARLLYYTFHNRQRIDRANADHHAITAAILDGRHQVAERLMRRHILQGFKAMLAQGFDD